MTLTRSALGLRSRRGLRILHEMIDTMLARIDARLTPPEKPLTEDELLARARREQVGRRAARAPWYHHRPREVQIPDSLKYFEAVHGTRATVEMLKARAQRESDE